MAKPVLGGTRERNRRGEGDRLRTEIVTAAERLLSTAPVEALSLRAVAREVGVSAPALYLHFADRRALVWAVLVHQFAALTTIVTDATAHTGDPVDSRGRLRAWCVAYCRFGLDHPGHYRALFESWTAEPVDSPLDELPGYELWQSLLGAVADCGPPAGELQELGMLVWAGLHGLVSLRINKPSFPWLGIEELIDAHLRRLMSGVR